MAARRAWPPAVRDAGEERAERLAPDGSAPDGCCGRVAKWLENAYVAKYSNHSRDKEYFLRKVRFAHTMGI